MRWTRFRVAAKTACNNVTSPTYETAEETVDAVMLDIENVNEESRFSSVTAVLANNKAIDLHDTSANFADQSGMMFEYEACGDKQIFGFVTV